MELAQVAIPNDLLQNLIFPHTHVKTILAAGSACREWNQWLKREQFWKTVFKTQFYFVESAPVGSVKISWRRLCIQASKLPKPGTFAAEVNNLRGGVVTGAKYNVQFKMYCQRREETIDVNVDCVFPLLVPGSDGNPTVQENLRVFAMWKKQNFWVGRIQTVNWESRTVYHIWDDNDKDTISFDEVFVYPNKEQLAQFRQRLANGDINSQEKVFSSRANLGERCGPYYEGVMNSLDSNWLVKFEQDGETRWVEPSRLNVREKIDPSSVVPKLLSWVDPTLRGRQVFYHVPSSLGQKMYLGQICDEDDFCSIWLAEENPNQGLLSFNILYAVIGHDKVKRHLSQTSFTRIVANPKLEKGMFVYYPIDEWYTEGKIESIVPGQKGRPARIEVSLITTWKEGEPNIYQFSANEVFVVDRDASGAADYSKS
jgi:hypothetical protein